ncbi:MULTISPECIES: DUF6676 family protein [Mycobacteriaceae]|uniref:Rv1476 family membrane protein n=1 Tax=Mycobacteriaceae TaxID=1762 RepID=UPI0007FC0996|nr:MULTISPECIES: DUF6676 family protein [Mycobacteriaceae]MCK0175197.1 hypothetical protein [Mycolicibacterium sp. F2034L]OBB59729.1 hypothetical protein A5757_11600 [Mycobacterium sp. 852013-51886_SCH5428379]
MPGFIPPDLDLNKVLAEVGEDGVSAPPGADEAGLRQVVSEAQADGIDLKIVVIDRDPHLDTPLRDIATEVGIAYPDSTVLALSPSFAGTYSDSIDRVTLEAGQDLAKTGNPVQSAQNFVDQITTDDFPWTLLTIALVLLVAAAAAATRLLQTWSGRIAPASVGPAPDTRSDQV